VQTSDRSEADRLGTKLLAALFSGAAPQDGPVQLGKPWDRFQRECREFLDNKPSARADAAMRAKLLVAFFGQDFDVRFFTARDQLEYSRAWQRGGIRVDRERQTRAIRQRSVEADLVLLNQMLSWA
jgi:hypothetical protein